MKYTAPNFVDINITDVCNMACRHCYIGKQTNSYMNISEAKNYIKQIADLGVFKVAITGGEPLLHPDWIMFIKEIINNNMYPMINTNGYLFNRSVCEAINDIAGNRMWIAVSVDGIVPGNYGTIRKWRDGSPADSAFKVVIDNIKEMLSKKFKVVINFTYTNKNKEDLIPLYEYLCKELGENNFVLNVILFGLSGSGIINANTLAVPYTTWYRDINDIMQLKISGKLKKLKFEPTCPWELYLPLEKFTLEEIENYCAYKSPLRSAMYRKFRDIGCHAGITNIVVNWNSTVYACGLYPQNVNMRIGNLKTDLLSEIWNNSYNLNALRNLQLKDLPLECQKCRLNQICGGGCRGAASEINKSIYAKDSRCPNLSR